MCPQQWVLVYQGLKVLELTYGPTKKDFHSNPSFGHKYDYFVWHSADVHKIESKQNQTLTNSQILGQRYRAIVSWKTP